MNKHLIVLVLLLSQSSCCNTKNVTPETPDIVAPVKVTEVNETPIEPEVKEVEVLHAEDLQIENIIPKPVETFDHSSFNGLLQKHVSTQGNVNYNSFKKESQILKNYITSLGENMPNDTWTRDEKLAYWINAYNALTIDLILRNPEVKSIKDIDDPWDQALWKLGDKFYDLNEIEHSILRKMN